MSSHTRRCSSAECLELRVPGASLVHLALRIQSAGGPWYKPANLPAEHVLLEDDTVQQMCLCRKQLHSFVSSMTLLPAIALCCC